MRGFAHLLVLVFIAALIGAFFFLTISQSNLRNQIISLFETRFHTQASVSTDTSYSMKTLVIKYFPVASGSSNIDISVTGDVGDSYDLIRQRTINVTNNLVADLTKATAYLGYSNASAQPALDYQVANTIEHQQAVPLDPVTRRPLYNQIMIDHSICDYVDNKGVGEVWLWAYQGPTYPGSQYPYLNISESKMAGPFGDISNSYRLNDMPACKNTYRVYTFNYGRGTGEAMESWGHQMEAELATVDQSLSRYLFQGPNYPQTSSISGRCGSVHNPPNARFEYDRENPTAQNSDCLDWNPDGIGTLSQISCANWGCAQVSDSDNPALNYMIWNWQNLPGRNNTKTYQGQSLRNWWDVHGDFDNVMGNDRRLTLTPVASPTPSAPPTILQTVVSDSFERADNSTSLGTADTGQPWTSVRGVWGIIAKAGYPANGCPAPGYAVIDSQSADGTMQVKLSANPQDTRVAFRVVDENNLYWVERRGGNPGFYDLSQMVNGSRAILAQNNSIAPADGDVIKIELNGPAMTIYINGVKAMTASSSIISSNKHGVGTWCTGAIRFDDFSFAIPVAIDTVSPVVTINTLADGDQVKGAVIVDVSAVDDRSVSKVEYYIDGAVETTQTVGPYKYTWDSLKVPNGLHNITVKAYDPSGNIGSDQVNLNVANGDLTAPTQPTNLSGKANAYNSIGLSWTVSTDNVGVVGYWIIRDGVTIATSTANSYTDSSVNGSASYGYFVIAYDQANNFSDPSNTVTINTPAVPDTQAPTTPTGLAGSAASDTQINLTWNTSTDNKGVTGYQVFRNNVQLAVINATSFGDSGLSASTSYTYTVKAVDGAGNVSAASPPVSVTTQEPPVVNGSISGTIVGLRNAPLSGAKVSILVNGQLKSYIANSQGVYSIVNLVPGTYTVNYSADKGYRPQTLQIVVGNGQNVIKNIILSKKK